MINNPNFDALEALKDQKNLLAINKTRIEGLLQTIDTTIKSLKDGRV